MSTLGDIIQSVRAQIPDPETNPATDNPTGFTLAMLIRWINDGMRVMAVTAPIIQDWYALPSEAGMDIYELPSTILSVEQLWYDLLPCERIPELDMLWSTKTTSRSYYFGPHSIHATPRMHVSPAAERSASSTTLSAGISATAVTIPVATAADFKEYGYIKIDNELIMYRTINAAATSMTQILRGQGGTVATTHNSGATVQEQNIFFKVSRLPTPVAVYTDVVEIPIGLTPLIELYVLAKVREAEQESALALQLRQEFMKAMDVLESKAQLKGLRQGIQVRAELPGPVLYSGGRLFVP